MNKSDLRHKEDTKRMDEDWIVYKYKKPLWTIEHRGSEETAKAFYENLRGTKRLVYLGQVMDEIILNQVK